MPHAENGLDARPPPETAGAPAPSPPPPQHQQEATAIAPLGATAFRVAEKRYQLHLDQKIHISKNGRRRGGRFVERPTDMSEVVDLHAAPSSPPPPGIARVWVAPLSDGGGGGGDDEALKQQQQQQQQQAAYTFAAHPGLVYLPGALPGAAQARLLEAALLAWPEPPAASNHTAAYPRGLPGLFAAAQDGLRSVAAPLAVSDDSSRPYGQTSDPKASASSAAATTAQAAAQTAATGPDSEPVTASTSAATAGGANTSRQQACWAPAGAGPPAADLLRRLRWVTLGPAFNWTARQYEPQRPHTPLPPELRQTALACAARAAAALGVAGAGAGAGASTSIPTRDNGAAKSTVTTISSSSSDAAGLAAAFAAYAPDAALVNYYRPGDTLGGHVDDAERDMRAPIVTVSLGAAAVFLMGGESRGVAPTALLLRSGDVLVLAGAARRSYHGVPRVLDGLPLPSALEAALAAAAAAAGSGQEEQQGEGQGGGQPATLLAGEARALARSWRINISVRSVS